MDISTDLGYSCGTMGERDSTSVTDSAVGDLWTKASACQHPLKLHLQDTAANVYYSPTKPKERAGKHDVDRSNMPSTSRSGVDISGVTTTAAAATCTSVKSLKSLRKRVDSILYKEPLYGNERDIARRLLAPYTGDGDSQKMVRIALAARVNDIHVRKRKENTLNLLRAMASTDGTYIDYEILLGLKKHSHVLAAEKAEEDRQEIARDDDGSAAFDETKELCFAAFGGERWGIDRVHRLK